MPCGAHRPDRMKWIHALWTMRPRRDPSWLRAYVGAARLRRVNAGANRDGERRSPTADAGRLVSDALVLALANLVEALRGARDARASAQPPSGGGRARAGAPLGAARLVVRLPARAAGDVVGAVASSVAPAVLRSIDLNALVDRVDVQRIIDRVDVEGLVRRVNLNELVAQVDVDALLERIDIGAVTREAVEGVDIPGLIQESTTTLATETRDAGRSQAMRADDFAARIVDRALRRSRPRATGTE